MVYNVIEIFSKYYKEHLSGLPKCISRFHMLISETQSLLEDVPDRSGFESQYYLIALQQRVSVTRISKE